MSYEGFRAWIGARLLGTQYATIRVDDSDIDAVAKKLGVDADLLLEVRAQAIIDLHDRGLAQPISNTKARLALDQVSQRLYQYQMWFPPEVFEVWRLECGRRGVHPPTFIRSLIHHYLLGTREPSPLQDWSWEGTLYRGYRSGRVSERAAIPHGAKRALIRRSTLLGTRSTHVVRALILGAMRGDYQSLPLVTSGMMYDDESRYYTGETRSP